MDTVDMELMEPGVVLDALIATEVMGWTFDGASKFWKSPGSELVWEPGWKPSTDMSDALEVRDRILALTPLVFELEIPLPQRKTFIARFKDTASNNVFSAEGEHAPWAICISALKAMSATPRKGL